MLYCRQSHNKILCFHLTGLYYGTLLFNFLQYINMYIYAKCVCIFRYPVFVYLYTQCWWSGLFKECMSFDYDEENITMQVVVVYEPFGQPTQPSFTAVGAEVFLDTLSVFSSGKSFIISIILGRKKTKEHNWQAKWWMDYLFSLDPKNIWLMLSWSLRSASF